MDPTVTGALIGAGGAVIVAVAGFLANVKNTSVTTAVSKQAVEVSQKAVEVSQKAVEAAQRTVEITEQGQVTARYAKAVEQLGSEKLDVRMGGIYALERVARDSRRDHPTVIEVLAAFVREHSREQWPLAEPRAEPPDRATRPDVQAAVTVIGRRNLEHDDPVPRIDLARAHLPGAKLGEANLTWANLDGADLTSAWLSAAVLTNASFTDATLDGATLDGAKLDGATLMRAKLAKASLFQTHLARAQLFHANLTGANLVFAQLTDAYLDDADLTGANLESADLSGASLRGSDFTGAKLTAAWIREGWPTPEGWVRDPHFGKLRRTSKDTGDTGN